MIPKLKYDGRLVTLKKSPADESLADDYSSGIELCKSFEESGAPIPLANEGDVQVGDKVFFWNGMGWVRGVVKEGRSSIKSGKFLALIAFAMDDREVWTCRSLANVETMSIMPLGWQQKATL